MEDIVESFAKRLGIEQKAARQGIAITCRHFLQVSEPIKATGLLSDSASVALKPVAANNITYVFSLKLEQLPKSIDN